MHTISSQQSTDNTAIYTSVSRSRSRLSCPAVGAEEEEAALAAEAAAIEAEAAKASAEAHEQQRLAARAWTAHKSAEGQVGVCSQHALLRMCVWVGCFCVCVLEAGCLLFFWVCSLIAVQVVKHACWLLAGAS